MSDLRRPLWLAMAAVWLLAGCAASPPDVGGSDRDLLKQARGAEENKRLHTDLVREMIDQDRLYAGLAHLEAQEKEFGTSDELRLLRAEILRKLGRTVEAERLYEELANTRYAGRAQHGLGLIYVRRDLALGTRYLRRAVEARPTDARIRNDLGYALMRQGELEEARLHLATAFQLDDGAELSRNNYILLLLLEGNESEARRVATQSEVTASLMSELRQQAQSLEQRKPEPPAPERPQVGGSGG